MRQGRKISLALMVLLYLGAGTNHFLHRAAYESIMPPYIPYHRLMVYVSGVCEIFFALLLIPVATRALGAWLIILLLIAIFPANIQMTINYWNTNNPHLWISIVRLPLQIGLVWWAWQFTKQHPSKAPFQP